MELYVCKIFQSYKYGYLKLIEEEAFIHLKDGMEWLKEEFFNNKSYDDQFTAELGAYEAEKVSQKVHISKKRFDYSGNELTTEEDPQSGTEPEYDPSFIPKYAKGDMVVFRKLVSTTDRTFKDTVAVITGVPLTIAERKSRKMRTEDLDYTDQMYMLEHISETGQLEHSHVPEEDLVLFKNQVPEELKALEHLSLHFKGTKPINEEVLLSMMRGEVYMLNRKSWRELI